MSTTYTITPSKLDRTSDNKLAKENVKKLLNFYSYDELADRVAKTEEGKKEWKRMKDYVPRTSARQESTIRPAICPAETMTEFQKFRQNFTENMFFPKAKVGQVYPLKSKPEHVTNTSMTFGKPTPREDDLYNLIYPWKMRAEVAREFSSGHEKRIVSHGSYFPSEQINRHYDPKSFDRQAVFGKSTKVDFNGSQVKRCVQPCQSTQIVPAILKRFKLRTSGELGKVTQRGLVCRLENDVAFGKFTGDDDCNVQALISRAERCDKDTERREAMEHLTKLRQTLAKRAGNTFHFPEFSLAMEERDSERKGVLPLKDIFEIGRKHRLYIDEYKMRNILCMLGMLKTDDPNEPVNYKQYLEILQLQYPLPQLGTFLPKPAVHYEHISTYKALCNDRLKSMSDASTCSRNSRGNKTDTIKELISPDVKLQHDLTEHDFDAKYPKELLRRFFKEVIVDGQDFNEVWERAQNSLSASNELLSINEIHDEWKKYRGAGLHKFHH